MRTARTIRAAALALLALAAGCHSYLLAPSAEPIPARAVPTKGGELLEVEDGEVFIAPEPRDIAAALGVRLGDAERGVLVTACTREGTGLAPGDRIVWAAASFPEEPTPTGFVNSFPGYGPALKASVASSLPRSASVASSLSKSDVESALEDILEENERKLREIEARMLHLNGPPAPAAIRATALSHAVGGIEDIQGYVSAAPYLHLDLVVERAGATVTACTKPRFERRSVFARRVRVREARPHDIALCSLEGWPERDLPVHALPGDQLVVRVGRDAPAAAAGLRPLDAVRGGGLGRVSGALAVVKPDGTSREVEVRSAGQPTSIWIPFVFAYDSDGRRTHLGLGPLDTLVHYSSKEEYDSEGDRFERTSRTSLATTFVRVREARSGGDDAKLGLAIFDEARLAYFWDWMRAGD